MRLENLLRDHKLWAHGMDSEWKAKKKVNFCYIGRLAPLKEWFPILKFSRSKNFINKAEY